jgi:hypothetical protein
LGFYCYVALCQRFQRKLADDMVRVGQSVWMFQLTYFPPQARASRFAAQHGDVSIEIWAAVNGVLSIRSLQRNRFRAR